MKCPRCKTDPVLARERYFCPSCGFSWPYGGVWTEHWDAFEKEMKARLAAGHEHYGDGVFFRDPPTTIKEMKEEAADIVGWGFVLWVRLQNLISAAEALREESDDGE